MQKYALLSRIAYLYYIEGKNQAEIAEELQIYRTSISRYLKQAKEVGIVSIEIKDFDPQILFLERELKERLGLKQVQVIEVKKDMTSKQKQDVFSKGAADYVKQYLQSNITIGLVWGKTIAGIVGAMESKTIHGLKVVPLVGGPGYMDTDYHVNTLVYEMSKKLNGQATFVNGTVIEESRSTKEAIVASKYFQEIQESWKELDVAITSVGGGLNEQSKWRNLLTADDLEELKVSEAVGDCCGRFFDKSGKLIKSEVDKRTIGLSLQELSKVQHSILLVSTKNKVTPLLALAKSGYINTLVIDSESATECLRRISR